MTCQNCLQQIWFDKNNLGLITKSRIRNSTKNPKVSVNFTTTLAGSILIMLAGGLLHRDHTPAWELNFTKKLLEF